MLAFQDRLERLPVPSLSETCTLYLRLVSPLLAEAELAATRRAVDEFVRPGGQGELLQGRLLRWSERPGLDNWLDPFWDDWYLCDDTPLVVNVSPGFALAGEDQAPVARAARLLAAAARFKTLVDREELEPDQENGAPRCMREYSRVLSSTRIPGATRDALEQYPDSRHVVVVRENRFFSLDVLDEQGRAYAAEDLERALQRIVDDVESAGASARRAHDGSAKGLGAACATSTCGAGRRRPGRSSRPSRARSCCSCSRAARRLRILARVRQPASSSTATPAGDGSTSRSS